MGLGMQQRHINCNSSQFQSFAFLRRLVCNDRFKKLTVLQNGRNFRQRFRARYASRLRSTRCRCSKKEQFQSETAHKFSNCGKSTCKIWDDWLLGYVLERNKKYTIETDCELVDAWQHFKNSYQM